MGASLTSPALTALSMNVPDSVQNVVRLNMDEDRCRLVSALDREEVMKERLAEMAKEISDLRTLITEAESFLGVVNA